ncbi:MAG: substrate-binding domain-containing protein [Firmicutes bacterium]|nr:substrate-binding domain-containing protein [Bacillota bacterium]
MRRSFFRGVVWGFVLMFGALVFLVGLAGCSGERQILVVSRESGSGTRDAFDSFVLSSVGLTQTGLQTNNTQTNNTQTNNTQTNNTQTNNTQTNYIQARGEQSSLALHYRALVLNGTGLVVDRVARNANAIAYMSKAQVDNLRMLSIDGLTPVDSDYSFRRPFNVVVPNNLSANARDFLFFLKSATATQIICRAGYIPTLSGLPYVPPTTPLSKRDVVTIVGSSSVERLMGVLIYNYKTLYNRAHPKNPLGAHNFYINAMGSSAGIKAVSGAVGGAVGGAVSGGASNIIGVASRNLTSAEASKATNFTLALDTLVVVVNANNKALDNITTLQLYKIFTGRIRFFSEIV